MPHPKRWTVVEREFLQDCRVFSVSRLHSRSPHTGRAHHFFGIDSPEWVNIVPVTSEGELVMIRQYRHGAGEITLETPGGLVDAGETPAQAAARELLEETGYRAREVVALGRVNPNPALFRNHMHAFAAWDVERSETEETIVELVARERVRALVAEGVVDHALVMAALMLFELFERRT